MSELDRFGIAGLLAALQGPTTDQMELASGTDLSTLGVDLTQAKFAHSLVGSSRLLNFVQPLAAVHRMGRALS